MKFHLPSREMVVGRLLAAVSGWEAAAKAVDISTSRNNAAQGFTRSKFSLRLRHLAWPHRQARKPEAPSLFLPKEFMRSRRNKAMRRLRMAVFNWHIRRTR